MILYTCVRDRLVWPSSFCTVYPFLVCLQATGKWLVRKRHTNVGKLLVGAVFSIFPGNPFLWRYLLVLVGSWSDLYIIAIPKTLQHVSYTLSTRYKHVIHIPSTFGVSRLSLRIRWHTLPARYQHARGTLLTRSSSLWIRYVCAENWKSHF